MVVGAIRQPSHSGGRRVVASDGPAFHQLELRSFPVNSENKTGRYRADEPLSLDAFPEVPLMHRLGQPGEDRGYTRVALSVFSSV